MRLFIDTGAATADSTDWEEFEYVINRLNPDAAGAYLERSTGGWNWEPVLYGSVFCQENVLQIAVPKKRWGLQGKSVHFNFKWSDNMQPLDGVEGDIMDFYLSGDVAPGEDLHFVFTTEEVTDSSSAFKVSLSVVLAVCVGESDSCGGDSFQYQKETGKKYDTKDDCT